MGALHGTAGGARGSPQVRGRGLRRDLDQHVVDPLDPRRGTPRRLAWTRLGSLARRRPSRRAAGAAGHDRRGARRRVCGRVHDLRGHRVGRAARDGGSARTRIRGGSARPDPARDADADPRPCDVRDGRAAARDRAAGVALVPPLPTRRLRRLRTALGAARGRSLRPRRTAVRADGRRGAAHQLPSGRARPRDAPVAPRLHEPAARRLPEPRPPRRARVALRRARRAGGVRGARARVAGRGRADHRWLLRHDARPHRGRREGRGRDDAGPPSPATAR